MRLKFLGGMGVVATAVVAGNTAAHADVLAQWTFQSLATATAGPIAPDTGSGSATSNHTATASYTNVTNNATPSGSGSTYTWGSTQWGASSADYWQFAVTTNQATDLSISFDQVSSNTGPNQFELEYSTNGTSFTPVATYVVNANSGQTVWNTSTVVAADHYTYNLPTDPKLDGTDTVYFRLEVEATGQASGTNPTVSGSGLNFIDNVIIQGTVGTTVPEPATLLLAIVGGAFGLSRRSRPTMR